MIPISQLVHNFRGFKLMSALGIAPVSFDATTGEFKAKGTLSSKITFKLWEIYGVIFTILLLLRTFYFSLVTKTSNVEQVPLLVIQCVAFVLTAWALYNMFHVWVGTYIKLCNEFHQNYLDSSVSGLILSHLCPFFCLD